MQFAHPKMLWLLAVTLPLLSLFLWWSWRRKQFLIAQFVRSRLLAHLTVGLSRTIQKTRMILLAAAVGFLLLALARPQWGFAWEEATQRGLDVIVAIDTSRSMLAEDIAPNRLQRAKLAALDLMRLAKQDRVGLVAFAGTAFLQCPLTLDDEAFRQSVVQLDAGIMPQGGTALAEAIRTAQGALTDERSNHRVLVLFTDGEDHDTGAVEAAKEAASAGIRVFTVGLGTPSGELLRERDEQGNFAYIKDAEGNVVKSRLNEGLLTEIATAGDGFYLPMSGASTVDVLYQRGLEPLPKAEISARLVKQYQERFQWPLALAILLLIIEMFLPDRKKVQRDDAILAASNPELRKLVAVLVLGLIASQAVGSPRTALRKYEAGKYNDAYQEYSRLLEKRPDDVRLQYNAGAAAYKAKEYADAVNRFSAAVAATDPQLQERAFYNLGNSLFRAGEDRPDQEKAQAWEQSIRQFEAALKLNPQDADAQANLAFVKRKLEELKQQQQEQSKDDQKKQDEKKDQDKDSQDQQKQQQDQKSDEQDPQSKEDQKKDKDSPSPDQSDSSDDEQNEEQERPKPEQDEKKDDNKDSASENPGDKSNENAKTNSGEAAQATPAGQMTPEQAKQLLDSQKANEKALMFIPPEDKRKSKTPLLKDW